MAPGRGHVRVEEAGSASLGDRARELARRYRDVRAVTESLAAPLSPEDCAVQSMPDASPVKWHLAHTSWFFETFVLEAGIGGYRPFRPEFRVLFNSYYNSVGAQHTRSQRGMLSRPALEEVRAYRVHVDQHMLDLLEQGGGLALLDTIELGLHHEQQHQELVLTDLKHMLSLNPLRPVYREAPQPSFAEPPPLRWHGHPGGVAWIGHDGGSFAFDNEGPRHRAFVEPFRLGSRLVTNGEFRSLHGGRRVRATRALAFGRLGRRPHASLAGATLLVGGRRHVAHADAFGTAPRASRRAGLPRELLRSRCVRALGKRATADARSSGRSSRRAPRSMATFSRPACFILGRGRNREETRPTSSSATSGNGRSSPYVPYPRYQPPPGAVGEYNGKFMVNQFVLRGGSCATPRSHLRASYRNFFPPHARWQFGGIRLARDGT